MPKTVLITSGRSPAGLDLMRTFTKYGHRVIVAESFPVHLCQFSRFGRTVRVPAPSKDPRRYVERIKQLVQQHAVDLVIPVYEEIIPLAHWQDEIGCEVFCTEVDVLKKLHDKYGFIELCQEHGCSHPETQLVSDASMVQEPNSIVLKPQFSRFGTDVYLCPSRQTVDSLDFSRPWVMQQFVDGDPFCGFCIADKGKILLHSIYPVEATLSGVCISYRHQAVAEIKDWMFDFVNKIGFSGSIGFDIVMRNGVVYPIECNPRITSGVHLFSQQQGLVDAFLEKRPIDDPSYPPAIAGPFVLAKAFLQWSLWKKWLFSKDVIFKWWDPVPLLGQGVVMSYLCALAWGKWMPMSEVSSLDIEYNGEGV